MKGRHIDKLKVLLTPTFRNINTQVKCIEEGDRDDTFWVHNFDQEIICQKR